MSSGKDEHQLLPLLLRTKIQKGSFRMAMATILDLGNANHPHLHPYSCVTNDVMI